MHMEYYFFRFLFCHLRTIPFRKIWFILKYLKVVLTLIIKIFLIRTDIWNTTDIDIIPSNFAVLIVLINILIS